VNLAFEQGEKPGYQRDGLFKPFRANVLGTPGYVEV
jgi:hypothetical protein